MSVHYLDHRHNTVLFHFRFKTHMFHKSFPPCIDCLNSAKRTDFTDSTKPSSTHLKFSYFSLARAVVRAPESPDINPDLKSLHWLKLYIYKVLTSHHHSTFTSLYSCSAPSLHSFFSCRNPLSPSFLFFSEGCLPTDHEDLLLSSDLTHVSSSFPLSPLSPSHLFHKSFPP